ncbi:MAG TPA: purine-nucleoside phosphorylase [Gemmatimonadaceae bacterium]|nr:purine-nucleoside phosphorylase [Gemmatimonadaceae bacterium]
MSDVAETVARAADAVREKIGSDVSTALILGSGLGGLADRIDNPVVIPYRAIPGFPPSSVPGHAARFVAGTLGDRRVLVASGRYHLYEGHSVETVALPTRVLHASGVRTLFVSNAAGGINRSLRAGDLMIIEDHLNLMSRTPLTGPPREGETRFPDMSAPYDPTLIRELRDAALECGIPVATGVYAALLGPSYETPAEIRMLDKLGADAVGMSTIPEVLTARALGMRVAGVSCITNIASGLSNTPLDHAEVLETTKRVAARFEELVTAFVQRVAQQ